MPALSFELVTSYRFYAEHWFWHVGLGKYHSLDYHHVSKYPLEAKLAQTILYHYLHPLQVLLHTKTHQLYVPLQ